MAKITGVVTKTDYVEKNIPIENKITSDDFNKTVTAVNLTDDELQLKTDKGTYSGTTGDLKDELDNAVFDGAVTYQTKALADAALPQPENTPCKIANDTDPLLNGSWAISGGVWVQNASVVSQITDSEDIKTSGNSLLVSDRVKEASNELGYYKIRTGFDWSSIPAEYANCELEITHNHNLGGATISIPLNVTLFFNGGKFSNGIINGNDTRIKANLYRIFDNDIEINKGGFDLNEIYPEWFGAVGDGVSLDGQALYKSFETGISVTLSSNKTYVNERRCAVTQKVNGNNATIKRNDDFIDIPISNALPSENIVVDTLHPDYSKIKVGMSVTFINNIGDSRKISWITREIKTIDGANITLNAPTSGASFDAGTASMTNQFPLLVMGDKGHLQNVNFNGGRDVYPPERAYWESGTTVNTIIGEEGGVATIEDCFFDESLADAIIAGGQTSILNNTFLRSGNGAIHLSGTVGTRIIGNYIYDSNLSDTLGHGFADGEGAIAYSTSVFDTTIADNIIDVCKNGIGLINTPKNLKATITGNRIQNFRFNGVKMLSVPEVGLTNVTRGFTISGNEFIGSQRDLEQKDIDYSYTPTNPLVQCNGYGVSIGAFQNAGIDNKYENIVITGNNFRDCGVFIENTLSFSLTGNAFDDADVYDSGITATPQLIVIRDSQGVFSSNEVVSNTTGAGKRLQMLNLKSLYTTPPYATKIGVSGNNLNTLGDLLSATPEQGVNTEFQPDLNVANIIGFNYPQTSVDNGTSIIDTGIRFDTAGVGFDKASIYDVYLNGGNIGSQFKATILGVLFVNSGFSGGNSQILEYHEIYKPSGSSIPVINISFVFWDGSTESSTSSTGTILNEIRAKVSGYTAGQEGGDNQSLRLTKRV